MKILTKTNWKAFNKAIKLKPEDLIKKIKDSELTGRGGAAFPTGLKYELVRKEKSDQKYMICNAHESEPGTFKDRFLMEKVPDNIIEGIAIAAYAIGAKKAYIYFKHEYLYILNKLKTAIIKAKPKLKKINLDIEIILGAGAYVCGEVTAIIDSIEGLRAEPRHKPPFPTSVGLFGKPTATNNVETLANLPLILTDNNWKNDLRLSSISGNVEKPGVYEFKLGTSIKEVIDQAQPSNEVKAIYLGYAGGAIKPEGNLSFVEIEQKKALLGNCTMIVVDKSNSIVETAKNVAEFFVHESCGKCSPCREGTFRILELLELIDDNKATKKDLETLEELSNYICQTSFCGLGKVSTVHLRSALKHFRNEFEEKCR